MCAMIMTRGTELGVDALYFNNKPRKNSGYIKATLYELDGVKMKHINTKLYGRVSEDAYRNSDAKPIIDFNIAVNIKADIPITDSLIYGLIMTCGKYDDAVSDEPEDFLVREYDAMKEERQRFFELQKEQELANLGKIYAGAEEGSPELTEWNNKKSDVEAKFTGYIADLDSAETVSDIQAVKYIFDYNDPDNE